MPEALPLRVRASPAGSPVWLLSEPFPNLGLGGRRLVPSLQAGSLIISVRRSLAS
jgi:hypothetical protein